MKPIDIHHTDYKVADFVSWSKNKTLSLNPNFQRRSVWKAGTKSYLMDTIVRGLPIPPIFLRDRGITKSLEAMREVIDGQQRLRTVLGFISPDLVSNYDREVESFSVKKKHKAELAGKKFSELTDALKRNILEYKFSVYTLPSDIDDREVIQIFRRMNSTNYSLNPQELRNSQYFGDFKGCVYKLAEEHLNLWREWKIFTIDSIARMYEAELTGELLILILDGKLSRVSKTRMDKIYGDYDESFPNRVRIEDRFRQVMDVIDRKFNEALTMSKYRKSLFYSLFAAVYDIEYGLSSDLAKRKSPATITNNHISKIKLSIERIDKGSAPENVLLAIKKSTTDTQSRDSLFKYLRG